MNAPILSALEGLPKARQSGGKFMACCPAHEDRNPSLSWEVVDKGAVLVHCFAGCEVTEVVAALGHEMRDLYPPRNGQSGPARPAAYEPMTRDRKGDWDFPSARKAAALAMIVGIDAYRAAVPSEIPWACRPLVYRGGVTLISGPPKAGKSTLAAQMQRCRETGDRLFGMFPVITGPTLLITEEGGTAVVHKTDGLHALYVLDRRAVVTSGLTFAQVLELIGSWAAEHAGGLAFIDTLAIWAGMADENDASQATQAIAAVTALAQSTDLAIVLIHHARKSGGDNGEAIRGSGAILATVDIAVEMSRVDPTSDERWLDVQGRVILPERQLLAFDRDTLSYRIVDQAAARLATIEGDLAGIPSNGPGLSSTDLRDLWQKDPRRRMEQLLNVGRLHRSWVAEGSRHGWRYWSIPAAVR